MRIVLLVLVWMVSFAAGFWFRGGLAQAMTLWAVAALAVCVLLSDLLGSPESRTKRMAAAGLAGVLFATGWYFGGRELETATAECAQRVEEVRDALEDHRRVVGQFPESLDELEGIDLPGRRVLRGSLLQYARTSDGYLLWFRDGRFRFTATHERELFLEGQV
jgi:hypothetical protein